MIELKKIDVLSLGKLAGLFGVIYGLLSAILVLILGKLAQNNPALSEQFGIASQMGVKGFLLFPILNGAGYLIAGMLVALIYNLLAAKIGGVKIELEDKKKKK